MISQLRPSRISSSPSAPLLCLKLCSVYVAPLELDRLCPNGSAFPLDSFSIIHNCSVPVLPLRIVSPSIPLYVATRKPRGENEGFFVGSPGLFRRTSGFDPALCGLKGVVPLIYPCYSAESGLPGFVHRIAHHSPSFFFFYPTQRSPFYVKLPRAYVLSGTPKFAPTNDLRPGVLFVSISAALFPLIMIPPLKSDGPTVLTL